MEVDVAINAPRALEIFNGEFNIYVIKLNAVLFFFISLKCNNNKKLQVMEDAVLYSIHIYKTYKRSYKGKHFLYKYAFDEMNFCLMR